MQTLELIALFIAYSVLLISIFLQLVCYNRKLEQRETIAFTVALLGLIVALSSSVWLPGGQAGEGVNSFTLLAMTAVGLTTVLNVISERRIHVSPVFKQMLFCISIFLAGAISYGDFSDSLSVWSGPVIWFLCASVVGSMLLIRLAPPQKWIMHRERSERVFAVLFMVVVPASLATSYLFEKEMEGLEVGFTVPVAFILLGLSKCWDDLKRLSLFQNQSRASVETMEYGVLTDREKEIALLLSKGMTYKEISVALFISVPTVKTHTSNIYRKLEVKNKTELTLLLIS